MIIILPAYIRKKNYIFTLVILKKNLHVAIAVMQN